MAETSNAIQFYPWPRGMYTNSDPIQIPKDTLQTAQNSVFLGTRDNVGGVTRRSPFVRQNAWETATTSYALVGTSATADVIYLADYWANVSGTKQARFVAVTSDRRVYVDQYNGEWSREITGTSVTLSSFGLGGVSHEVMNEDLLLGFKNSTVGIGVWEAQSTSTNLVRLSSTTGVAGTSSSIFTPITRCWLLRQHQSRMFYAGDPQNRDTLYFSQSTLYNDFRVTGTAGSAGSIQINPGDGDPEGITAIFPSINSQELYVSKRRKLYKIITEDPDPDNWAIVKVSDAIGCVSHNTCKTIAQRDVFFESDLGIHSLFQIINNTGIIEDTLISFPISADYRDMDQLSKTQHSAAFWPEENLYMHTAKTTGSEEVDRIYVYDLETGNWGYWDTNAEYDVGTSTERVSFNALCLRFSGSAGKSELYIGDNNAYVNFYDINAEGDLENLNLDASSTERAGTPILQRLVSALIFPQETWLRESTFTDIWILGRAKTDVDLRVSYRIDNQALVDGTISIEANGGNILGTTLLGSSTYFLGLIGRGVRPAHVSAGGYGYGIEIALEFDEIGQVYEIYGIIIKYEDSEESRDIQGQ